MIAYIIWPVLSRAIFKLSIIDELCAAAIMGMQNDVRLCVWFYCNLFAQHLCLVPFVSVFHSLFYCTGNSEFYEKDEIVTNTRVHISILLPRCIDIVCICAIHLITTI